MTICSQMCAKKSCGCWMQGNIRTNRQELDMDLSTYFVWLSRIRKSGDNWQWFSASSSRRARFSEKSVHVPSSRRVLPMLRRVSEEASFVVKMDSFTSTPIAPRPWSRAKVLHTCNQSLAVPLSVVQHSSISQQYSMLPQWYRFPKYRTVDTVSFRASINWPWHWSGTNIHTHRELRKDGWSKGYVPMTRGRT